MKRNFILLGLGVCALLLGPRRADAGAGHRAISALCQKPTFEMWVTP